MEGDIANAPVAHEGGPSEKGPTMTYIQPGTRGTGAKAASDESVVPKKAAPKKATGIKRNTGSKRTASSKKASETKKAVPKKEAPDSTQGCIPPELKGFDRTLKNYAEHTRMTYDASTANSVFTEYMAEVFRDLGNKMVLIRDPEMGIITMLLKPRGDDDESIKSKIIVKCAYLKKGSIQAGAILEAQENGALYRGDETWCVTATDFTEEAIRKSKKKDAKVKLFDGKRLYKEFLSKLE